MDTKAFLDHVLPADGIGYRALRAPVYYDAEQEQADGSTTISRKSYERHWCLHTNEDATNVALFNAHRSQEQLLNMFFGIATYENPPWKVPVLDAKTGQPVLWPDGTPRMREQFRTQENTKAIKVFVLDLDVSPDGVGDAKHFATREEAITALRDFCKEVGLPKPLIVFSGAHGVHVYWVLNEPVATSVWKPVADKFKQLCMACKLRIDPAVPADSARVLRVVGTVNYKLGSHLVEVANPTIPPTIAFDVFDAIVTAGLTARGVAPTGKPSGLAGDASVAALFEGGNNVAKEYDNLPVSLAKITEGCALLAATVAAGGADDTEPEWYAKVGGIASFCEEPEHAAVMLSCAHPTYSEERTLQKMHQWSQTGFGPSTCVRLHELSYGKHDCTTCPHYGRITTPLQLGRIVKSAPEPVIQQQIVTPDGEPDFIQVTIPNPPFPFKRAENGTIFFEAEKDGGGAAHVEICPVDIYPTRLMDDEVHGERMVSWRAHLPHGVMKDVLIPQRMHSLEASKLMGELGANGITIQPKNAKFMQEFMVAYIKQLQQVAPADKQYSSLGWRNGEFIMPTHVLSKSGTKLLPYALPFTKSLWGANGTSGVGSKAGTLQGWIDAVRLYDGPENLDYQLAICGATASVLLRFTNVSGMIWHLFGPRGCGKSTAQKVALSMWGDHAGMMVNGNKQGVTMNALFKTISLYHSIPVGLDEVTSMGPDAVGVLAYNMTQGVGRTRVTTTGQLIASEHWECNLFSSANVSFYGQLAASKSDASAEMSRIIELRVHKASDGSKARADELIRQLDKNYGHVGDILIAFILANEEKIATRVTQAIESFDRLAGMQSSERFWSAGFASAVTMCTILNHLGLVRWDANALLQHAIRRVNEIRRDVNDTVRAPEWILADMLEDFGPNMLTLHAPAAGATTVPLVSPRGAIYGRHEVDTRRIYLACQHVKDYCAERHIDYRTLTNDLRAEGIILEVSARKVLGAGTAYAKAQVRCIVVDAGHERLIGAAPQLQQVKVA